MMAFSRPSPRSSLRKVFNGRVTKSRSSAARSQSPCSRIPNAKKMTLTPGETPGERARPGMFLGVTPELAVAQGTGAWQASVGAREDGSSLGGLAAMNASARTAGAAMSQDRVRVQGDAAHGRARLLLDGGFALPVAAPIGEGEARLDGLPEVVIRLGFVRVRAAEGQGLVQECLLVFAEQLFERCR